MTAFRSLYLPGVDNLAETIRTALIALGYESYDPFGLIPGKAYPQAARLFVAPSRNSWTRVLVAPDSAPLGVLLPHLAPAGLCLSIALDAADAQIDVSLNGVPTETTSALAPYLQSPECAEQTPSAATTPTLGGIALDALPGDVQALAQQVDLKQAESMFARLSRNLAPKSGGDASALPQLPDWNSAGGRKITALMDCLGIPGWREPDFVTLRDAYALHVRRQRTLKTRPNAKLYPGDAEALAAVPDALDYTPIYAGKS
jgi:hypothetical protein